MNRKRGVQRRVSSMNSFEYISWTRYSKYTKKNAASPFFQTLKTHFSLALTFFATHRTYSSLRDRSCASRTLQLSHVVVLLHLATFGCSLFLEVPLLPELSEAPSIEVSQTASAIISFVSDKTASTTVVINLASFIGEHV